MNRHLLALGLALSVASCTTRAPRDKVIDYLALCYAARGENELLVEALLQRGAPVDALHPDSAGMLSAQAVEFDSPLQAAAERGNVAIVRLLLQHKPWVDHRCCDSPAALGGAAAAGHAEIVEMLLKAGADPWIKSSYSSDLYGTPLDAARRNGHTAVVRLLETAMKARP